MALSLAEPKSRWKTGQAGEPVGKFGDSGKLDLLVMGFHGHGTWVNRGMGSVVTEVLAHSKVPVPVVLVR